MKLGYTQTRQLDAKAYEAFHYLWKTDNSDWVTKRKEAWRSMVEARGLPPLLAKFWGGFYVFGEECPSYIEDEQSGEMESIQFEFKERLAFMPFETVAQVQEFFEYAHSKRGTRSSMHESAEYVGGCLKGLPERDQMVKLITEALFCEKYFAEDEFVRDRKRKTVRPIDFVIGYSRVAFLFQDMDKYEWDYRMFSFDYFIRCVKYCEERELVSESAKEALMEMYVDLMKQSDDTLNEHRKELKYKLISAAEDENAVDTLKAALVATKSG